MLGVYAVVAMVGITRIHDSVFVVPQLDVSLSDVLERSWGVGKCSFPSIKHEIRLGVLLQSVGGIALL